MQKQPTQSRSRRRVKISRVTQETPLIRSFELVDPTGSELSLFTAGSHIDVFSKTGDVRQYSICNDPNERDRYVLGVLREKRKGLSHWMHDELHEGSELEISLPRNHFKLCEEAASALLLGGGIGITPLLAMTRRLATIGQLFQLIYCTRSPADTPFFSQINQLISEGSAVLHHDGGEITRNLNLGNVLAAQKTGQHLYVCGPSGMLNAARQASAHWAPGSVHIEHFQPQAENLGAHDDRPFRVRLLRSGFECEVPAGKSIVEVLRERGVEIETMCEGGVCGTCKTRYVSGIPDHRDVVLDDNEREAYLMACCARSLTPVLELDL